MTEQEILKVRKSLREEWRRRTFDAFLLGMDVLLLTDLTFCFGIGRMHCN